MEENNERAPWEDTPKEKAKFLADLKEQERIMNTSSDDVPYPEEFTRKEGNSEKKYMRDVIKSMQEAINELRNDIERIKHQLKIGDDGIPENARDVVFYTIAEEFIANGDNDEYVGVLQSVLVEKLLSKRNCVDVMDKWDFCHATTIKYLRLLANCESFGYMRVRTGNKNEYRWERK